MGELRERILAAKDIASERVKVDAWGVEVEVRGLSGRARAELLQKAMKNGQLDMVRMYPLLVIACTYDPQTGERVFGEDDVDAIADKAGGAIETVAMAAARLSALDAEAVERSKSSAEE